MSAVEDKYPGLDDIYKEGIAVRGIKPLETMEKIYAALNLDDKQRELGSIDMGRYFYGIRLAMEVLSLSILDPKRTDATEKFGKILDLYEQKVKPSIGEMNAKKFARINSDIAKFIQQTKSTYRAIIPALQRLYIPEE